jgi:hypothetical protein
VVQSSAAGISLASSSNNTIGGPSAGDGNVIGGAGVGIEITTVSQGVLGAMASGNVIQGNWIGINPTGTTEFPNQQGIIIHGASGNLIGGTSPGDGNTIEYNQGDGVDIIGADDFNNDLLAAANDNPIVGNSIYGNGGLGIDLEQGPLDDQSGITTPVAGVHAAGSNNLQNQPTISSATIVGGQLQISGNFLSDTASGSTLKLDVYVSNPLSSVIYPQGQTYVGEATIINGTGTVNFGPLDFNGGAIGQLVSATLTDANGNTSEFSTPIFIGNPFLVTNTNDSGTGSLRQAIIDSDSFSSSGPNVIQFDIPGSGVHTIDLLTPLPSILEPTVINGYSQPGSSPNTSATSDNANIDIVLSGADLTVSGDGLFISGSSASGSTIEGLAINGFSAGIGISNGATGNTIEGNFLGTDSSGMTAVANTGYGIEVQSAGNIIGGTNPAAANVISGNGIFGLYILGASATGNSVEGNYIGTNAANTAGLGNAQSGVSIENGASSNIVGGLSAGDANVIDDNQDGGVFIGSYSGGASVADTVVGNSIYNNDQDGHGYRGIELVGIPVATIRGNNPIFTPNLTSATYQSGTLTLAGNFVGTGSGSISLDVYVSNNLDQSGVAEGQTYLGRFTVSNGSGTVSFGPIAVAGTFSLGQFVTVTLTDSAGNTSEFSNPAPVISAGQTTFVVTNTNDSGPGSLRGAIQAANLNPSGSSVIDFDIPGSGVHTIEPLTALPTITQQVTINGYSQPGSSPNTLAVGDNAVILIDLNGINVPEGFSGLAFFASNSEVTGLAIGGFAGVPGTTANSVPTGGNGILADTSVSNITIIGNFIGTDATGNTADGNTDGIYEGSSDDTIGGLAPADRNIISGDTYSDIYSLATGSIIQGNYIGTDTSGMKEVSTNSVAGVQFSSQVGGAIASNLVQLGGSTAAAKNVIVSPGVCVILFFGSSNEIVQGNDIGVNVNASADFTNTDGILVQNSTGNTIGGAAAGDGNIIGGDVGGAGIQVNREDGDTIGPDSSGNVIQGNWIGISPTGTALSNFDGIDFAGTSNNTVGGTVTGDGNIIADNTADGVVVEGVGTTTDNDLTAASGDTIIGNSIYNEGQLGIDLFSGPEDETPGLTLQTPGTHPSGSNNLQNFPNITSANIVGGQLQISGNFVSDTPVGTQLKLDVYVSDTFGAEGFGPGQTFVGEVTVTSNGSGTVNFGPLNFTGGALGQFVSATLTDASGNTSEFSNALYIGDPFVVTNTNDSGQGSLRQAIINANLFPDNPNTDLIHFDIPGSGVHVINLLTALPVISNAVTIDGYSQPGSSFNTLATGDNAVIEIELNGASAGAANGLGIAGTGAAGSVIEGLDINRFEGAGISTGTGATNLTIVGNFIGTDPTGTTSLANGGDGIFLATSNNFVGGPVAADANVLSGNTGSGVLVFQAGATENIIEGNYIGSNAADTAALGNGEDGVTISDGASDNLVGGTGSGDGNVITGNAADGVFMNVDSGAPYPVNNTIVGNSMYLNTGLGIQLTGYVYNGNNPNLQNNPLLTAAVYQNGVLTLDGFFEGSGSGTLQLDLYESNTLDPSGLVEGKIYLGGVTIENGTGLVSLGSIDITGAFSANQLISATLTNPSGETSEISNPVEVTTPATNANPLVVTTTNDSGAGSLRAAILFANANPLANGVPNVISFDIPGAGVQVITPLTPLPEITAPVTIDGYTQTGATQNTLAVGDNANILIQISAADLADSASVDVLALNASNSLIEGLEIDGFSGAALGGETLGNAIHIMANNTNDVIAGNFLIGGEPSGLTYAGFGQYGVFVDSASGILIGGTTPGARNVISQNDTGIFISGANATGDVIQGNYIGTTISGGAQTIFQGAGIDIEGSGGDTVGGTAAGAGNLVAENNNAMTLNPSGAVGELVEGNDIATNAAGTAPMPLGTGIVLTGPNNTIGGTAPGAGNIIDSGLTIEGLNALGASDSGGNTIQGNTITGTSLGTYALAIVNSANNLVGGTTPAARNVLDAISITDAGSVNNTIQGNYIGINAAGTAALPFDGGILIFNAGANLIGGTAAGAGNVIAGSPNPADLGSEQCIVIENLNDPPFFTPGAGGDTIEGNIIGLDPTGTFAITPVSTGGILIAGVANVTIGGSAAGAGNLISGNGGDAIEVSGGSTGTIIEGNTIGTDKTGKVALGNTGDGIDLVGAINTTIGGTSAGDGNLIENNTNDGVYVDTTSTSSTILGNSIFANGNLGIELQGYNPTATPVAGNSTNIPVIVSAAANGSSTIIQLNLDDGLSQTYRVEFFSNPAVDHSGFGEGQVYLGFANITTNSSGNASSTVTLPFSVATGLFITATVTDTTSGNTSEFSAAAQVVQSTAAPVVVTNPLSQTLTVGQDASFTASVTGVPTPTVQWMMELAGGTTFSPINGATFDTLDLGAATLAETGNKYEAVFTNGIGGPITTTVATLTVNPVPVAPIATANPMSQTLTVGQDASFTAAATGTPTPTVQWMVELAGSSTFSPINGATSDTLDLGAATRIESGNEYEAVFSNGGGSPATTTPATLTVNLATAGPIVATNPVSQTVTVGQDATFTAAANGNPMPNVQWMVELSGGTTFSPINGATSDTLDLGAGAIAENGNKYEAVFNNGVGNPATTTAASLTVNPSPVAPVVTTNPLSQTLTVGQDVSFTAAATGTPTPTVQWMMELAGGNTFSPINGATSDTLDLGAATLAESGNEYEAVFGNGVGSPATSTAATLTVQAAPVVTTNPLSQVLTIGQDVTFTAAATGTPTPTVQWMVELSGGSTFSPINGATSDTLDLGAATLAESGNKYEAVFSNGVGSPATTSAATLMVTNAQAAPVVTSNPVSQTLTVGQDVSFTAAASGNPAPTVQWMMELAGGTTFSLISGATSDTLDLGAATLAESGNKYEAVFTNGVGNPATTTAAMLTVNPAPAAPVVTTNPLSQTLTVGQDVSFTAAATGTPTPTVQWMMELSGGSTFSPINGATSGTLDLGAATLAESGNKYEAVFSNGVGSPATTTAATLTVQAAPAVTTNPLSQTLTVGQDASFTAAASGTPTPTVQWMVELSGGTTFSPINGATSDTLDLGAATLAESGNKYEAVFSNGVGGPATTSAATLTVNPAQAAPVVTTNPLSQTLTVGQDAKFTAAAAGTPTPTVQWMMELAGGTSFSPINGATSDTLDLGAATLAESGNKYEAVFSNGVGSPATTSAATLTINPAQVAPVVTTNPLSQTLTVGQDAKFTVAATGTPTPTVQWMVELAGGTSFSPISGATSDTLDLGAATLAESGNKYEAVFSNGVGSPAATTAATLTVNPVVQTTAHLVFKQQPQNVIAGQTNCGGIVVYVEDQNGNLIKTDNSTVTISIYTGPAGAKIYGTVSVKARNGVATFSNLTFDTAGNYTLLATDPGDTSVVSHSFCVVAAAPCKLAFIQTPSSPRHGVAFEILVALEDRFGNICTNVKSTIKLSLSECPRSGKLSGVLSATTVNGVATFSGLSVNMAGDYTLLATSSNPKLEGYLYNFDVG